jgi:hypothetical protein
MDSRYMSILEIVPYLIDITSYTRLQSSMDISMSYEDFIHWNIHCLNELSAEELQWVYRLCDILSEKNIHIVDLYDCSENEASGIYYTMDKKLCIFSL